jgi:hypothetical protein
MTAKQAAARAWAKRREEEQLEAMGATFRQFHAVCTRSALRAGNFYGLPEAERDEWKDKAKAASVTLGLKPTTETKEG